MPIFYLHVCDGAGFVEDTEGHRYSDFQCAREAAIEGLRDILAAELRNGDLNTGSFIEIENEHHELVTTVSFDEVVRLASKAPTRPLSRR